MSSLYKGLQFEAREYSRDMLPEITALFTSYFTSADRLSGSAYSEWLYAANPYGRAMVVQSKIDGSLAAFMAMVPLRFVRGLQERIGFQVVNVLVHPQHQGRGLFAKMIAVAEQIARTRDAFLLGYPNRSALGSWKRAKMHFLEELAPLLIVPSLQAPRRRKVIDRRELAKILSNLPPNCGEQWQLDRSVDFLEWRYLSHPVNHYCLLEVESPAWHGLTVSRKLKGFVHLILDVIGDDQSDLIERCTPVPAIRFAPKSDVRRWELALPTSRRISVFMSDYCRSASGAQVIAKLGLSASDF